MLTLLKHAYSTRLKSSKHAKMSAYGRQLYSGQHKGLKPILSSKPKVRDGLQ